MISLKILRFLAKLLFVLCLPVLLLTVTIAGIANSQWLYQYGFEKYQVSRTTGLSATELHRAAAGLIDYFNSGEEYIALTVQKDSQPLELFNEREVAHLKDVKGLLRLDYRVLLGTFLYTLVYVLLSLFRWRDRRQLARGLVAGGSLTLGLMLLLGAGILLNFNQIFVQFHLISFANDLWQLDPTRDYLIMLFPGGFWFDAFLLGTIAIAVGAVISGGVGGYLLLHLPRLIDKGNYQ